MGNFHLSGTIAILLERGILTGVFLVFVRQLLKDGTTQHTIALAMDEHERGARFRLVGLHGLAEHIHLIIEDVARRHAGSSL